MTMKTISAIKRKSDNKVFGCFFRNGAVTTDKHSKRSDWIARDGSGEEIDLYGIDTNKYEILEQIEEPTIEQIKSEQREYERSTGILKTTKGDYSLIKQVIDGHMIRVFINCMKHFELNKKQRDKILRLLDRYIKRNNRSSCMLTKGMTTTIKLPTIYIK